jgi:hypothetical protein
MLYYDIVTRFSKPNDAVWAWGLDITSRHLGMASVATGRNFAFYAKPSQDTQALTDLEEKVINMRDCAVANFAYPNYTKAHGDLLLLHLGTRKNDKCMLFANTKPSTAQEILQGDTLATLVAIKPHPRLQGQEGLYAEADIKTGLEVCQYWGKLALLGAHGQGAYCFRLTDLDKEPMVFEGAFECKARRINSFPLLPFNVIFDLQQTAKDGLKMMVSSCMDIPKVTETPMSSFTQCTIQNHACTHTL